MAAPPQLTVEDVRAALHEAVQAFSQPENEARVRAAIDTCPDQSNLMLMMSAVIPVAMEIQGDVIAKYGFSRDHAGATAFMLQCATMSARDPEIKALTGELRAKFAPQLNVPGASAAVPTEEPLD